MKQCLRVTLLTICLAVSCVALPTLAADESKTADSETLSGLVKDKDGNRYYYKNGEKITNTLKKVNGYYYYFGKDGAAYTKKLATITNSKGDSNIYYFKSNGRAVTEAWKKVGGYYYYFRSTGKAVKASTTMNSKYNVTTKKIKGKTYGFDCEGHRTNGVYVSEKGKLYYFNKKGVYNASKSKSLRSAMKKAGTDLSSLISLLNKYEGKYKNRIVGNEGGSCLDYGATDVFYEYKHLSISAYRKAGSSKEILYQMYPD